jgi:hypothetical protein
VREFVLANVGNGKELRNHKFQASISSPREIGNYLTGQANLNDQCPKSQTELVAACCGEPSETRGGIEEDLLLNYLGLTQLG